MPAKKPVGRPRSEEPSVLIQFKAKPKFNRLLRAGAEALQVPYSALIRLAVMQYLKDLSPGLPGL